MVILMVMSPACRSKATRVALWLFCSRLTVARVRALTVATSRAWKAVSRCVGGCSWYQEELRARIGPYAVSIWVFRKIDSRTSRSPAGGADEVVQRMVRVLGAEAAVKHPVHLRAPVPIGVPHPAIGRPRRAAR